MEDNQPQPIDDDLTSFTPSGSTREFALARRWGKLARHITLRQIFELLSKEPEREMYLAEIARALNKNRSYVHQEIHHLVWTNVVDIERRGSYTYYRLRPGMVEQYQQWLASQQPDEPEP